MALPTDLKSMDYGYQGEPFVETPANGNINLFTMDWAYQGQPFVRNNSGGGTPKRCLLGCGI
jgi:hypothetical protein